MSRVEDYLAISEDYCRWLGDLRWSPSGEAVEYACEGPEIGMTFAMGAEISLFLEGFHSSARPISLMFILHLLHVLGLGTRIPRSQTALSISRLEDAFRKWGLPLRNAGALCAQLCRDVPRVPDPPALAEIHLALTRPSPEPLGQQRTGVAEVPPLGPVIFEGIITRALSRLSSDELGHWLRYGRGSIGEGVEERVPLPRPRSLSGALSAIERRPRLAGTTALAVSLAGALTLPPRRLAAAALPMGGYADVATRGQPERILPTQLALEADEFVRRFAQHELLFYQREEPKTPVPEEVVVVLDQGIRTWGVVRLALAAAAMALGRQAERRKIPFSIAATSREGLAVDPGEVDAEELGSLLESSDLSTHPGLALERVLEQRGGSRLRDVVLLTHPRSLREPDLVAAARRVDPSTRLFAVSVDDDGHVALSEVARGSAVVRSTLRLDLPGADDGETEPGLDGSPELAAWQGDVESPGFPFALGSLGTIPDSLFDFDSSGDWILYTGQQGILHACRTDGTRVEMLPRLVYEGRPLSKVEAVVGVAGGFVVVGKSGESHILGHYDFASRRCTAHQIASLAIRIREWYYLRNLDSIVARSALGPVVALDLSADPREACYPPRTPSGTFPIRAERALLEAKQSLPQHQLFVSSSAQLPSKGRALRLHESSGAIDIQDDAGEFQTIVPTNDGRPFLEGQRIRWTRTGGDIIAADFVDSSMGFLVFFSVKSFRVISSQPRRRDATSIALSSDGRFYAHKSGPRHLVVLAVAGESTPCLITPRARYHHRVEVMLGKFVLTISVGDLVHILRWDGEVLESSQARGNGVVILAREFGGQAPYTVPATGGRRLVSVDLTRFYAACAVSGLVVLVDSIGQVSVLRLSGELVCMFYVFRGQVAGWMPDGTRIGPATLTGGAATVGGEKRFAAALRGAAAGQRSQAK